MSITKRENEEKITVAQMQLLIEAATQLLAQLKLPEKHYSAKMIAEVIPRPVSTIREWIVAGKFGNTVNDGKQHYVKESDLLAWIERHTGEPVTYTRALGGGKARQKKNGYVPKRLEVNH